MPENDKINPAAADKWQVRAEDGSVFGPATMDALLAWARDGRLSPAHVISCDGERWTPVTSRPELRMDWVSEISPGRFYGPIHRDALDELVRSGTIDDGLPCFVRASSPGDSPALLRAENASLKAQLESLRKDFSERAAALEESVRKADAAAEDLRGRLETRDLEFEAERQAFRAGESRLQAEAQALRASESKWKADCAAACKRAEALDGRLRQAATREKAREAAAARIAELEKELAMAAGRLEAAREKCEAVSAEGRKNVRDAETALLAEREDFRKYREDAQAAVSRLKDVRMREESIRKLLQQASSILDESAKSASDASGLIEDGVLLQNPADVKSTPPPAPGPDVVLGAIEAQAQREIRKLDGKSRKGFFK